VKISVKKGNLADAKSQAIILALFEDQKKLTGNASEIDQKTGGLISELMKCRDFEAKHSQISVLYTKEKLPAKRVALVGLGKYSEFNLEKLRGAFAAVMQHLRNINVKEADTSIDLNLIPKAKDKIAQAVLEGAIYAF
jgi:leucyl aminopeptidase